MENDSLVMKLKFDKPQGIASTTYLTHNFHSYPAKFIPQIPRAIIQSLTKEGEVVLDPFCGCGTTLVEAKLLNRNAIGIDLHPIAALVSKAKTTKLNTDQIKKDTKILSEIKEGITNYYNSKKIGLDYVIPSFNNRDHWFQKDILNELAVIKAYINKLSDKDLKNYLYTAFSSIIVTVSNQESMTRFAAINKDIKPFRTFFEFSKKLEAMNKRILEFSDVASDSAIEIYQADTQNLNFLKDNCVDCIVTSPPYANTYDYYLYHKFSMYWLDYDVKKVQDNEIGSRNRHSSKKEDISTFKESLSLCLKEMSRVLKSDKYAVIVIGDSVIRGDLIKIDELMKEIALKNNFEFIRKISYSLKQITRMFNPKFTNPDKLEHIMFFKNKKDLKKETSHNEIKMVDEIRIYYESLEQGANYIKPIIEKSLKKFGVDINIKLVKLKGSYLYYSKKVAPIIFWKNPDILITVVKEDIEYTVLMVEFSNAVFTEDHELQRFDGLVAGADNNCVYAKISPISKQSQSQHGGNINFDYVGPFSLIFNKFNKMFYHFDWKCDNKGVVIVDDEYLSCPKQIKEVDTFIEHLISFITSNKCCEKEWVADFEKEITKNGFFKDWQNKLAQFKLPEIKNLKTPRTEWVDSSKECILKLNRFGHAMDPERGMLSYYGTLYNNIVSKMSFDDQNDTWYKDTPKEQEIKEYIKAKGLKNGYDFLYCFMLGSGLHKNKYFNKIVSNLKENKQGFIKIDLTAFLNKHYLFLNKAMRTIFKYSTYFFITDQNDIPKVKFVWKKFDQKEDYTFLPDATKILEREIFEEDDITYVTVHNILKPNGYKILAVSYPGAQADRVILIAPGTGRKQERKYIDIISYLPKKYTNLQENKGNYSPTEIQKEINELTKYKTQLDYKQGLNSFILRFDKNAPEHIKIGVGFWANSSFTISKFKNLDLKSLDYFVYVAPDKKEWVVWSTGKGDMFKKTKGKVMIPKTFEVLKSAVPDKEAKPLKEFLKM